ncbi:MAG: hypothetical protein ACP5D8_05500 [Fidelibacterota bacterium]
MIGDQPITLREFVQRAEYTIRPDYCKQNNYVQKKIILNSLIAEKLYALESGELHEIDLLLQGRREQQMRQLLFLEEGYQKVQMDSSTLLAVFDQAGRTYRLDYFTVNDTRLANNIEHLIWNEEIPFDTLYQKLSPDPLPKRELSWKDQDIPLLHQQLYLQPVHKGEVLGPFINSDGTHLFVRIAGWTSQLAMGEKMVSERWNKVSEYVTHVAAKEKFEDFVSDVMKGQEFTLNEAVFAELVQFLSPVYLKTKNQKESVLRTLFDTDATSLNPEFPRKPEIFDEAVVLFLNGTPLTFGEFREMVKRHPLVFRAQKLTAENFPQQLKYAIADLLRDEALNKIARDRGYEKRSEIQHTMAMWQDAYKARAYRESLIKNLPEKYDRAKDEKAILKDILEPHTQQLQEKYSEQIQINTQLLTELKLSSVDLMVIQPNQPWPVLVPSFPVYTQDSKLDYGSVLTK